MRILIHHDNARAWRAALADRLPEATLATSDEAGDFEPDYLVVWKPPASVFAHDRHLKGIFNLGAGVDALLNHPALPAGVPIVKLRDAGMAPLIADYCRYGVLHFRRDFDRFLRAEAAAAWQPRSVTPARDWGVGVLGLGAIGAEVAAALAADGYPVHGWSRTEKALDDLTCHHGDDGLIGMLGQVRTLITLLPDTPDTRAIVDDRLLADLPAGATLINPGRGALIDDDALLAALGPVESEGRLRGALLDAFVDEPLAADSPLWSHPRVRITPHIAGPTPIDTAADQIVTTLRRLEAGEAVDTVDPALGY